MTVRSMLYHVLMNFTGSLNNVGQHQFPFLVEQMGNLIRFSEEYAAAFLTG